MSKVNVNDLILLVHLQLPVKTVLQEICNSCNFYSYIAKCMTVNIVLHISYYGGIIHTGNAIVVHCA